MSIKVEEAKTPFERADAISNLIEQMALAHSVKDETQFKRALNEVRGHCFELVQMLEEMEETCQQ